VVQQLAYSICDGRYYPSECMEFSRRGLKSPFPNSLGEGEEGISMYKR
jgi:hypothetical protein